MVNSYKKCRSSSGFLSQKRGSCVFKELPDTINWVSSVYVEDLFRLGRNEIASFLIPLSDSFILMVFKNNRNSSLWVRTSMVMPMACLCACRSVNVSQIDCIVPLWVSERGIGVMIDLSVEWREDLSWEGGIIIVDDGFKETVFLSAVRVCYWADQFWHVSFFCVSFFDRYDIYLAHRRMSLNSTCLIRNWWHSE